jgi:hypothetical protein
MYSEKIEQLTASFSDQETAHQRNQPGMHLIIIARRRMDSTFKRATTNLKSPLLSQDQNHAAVGHLKRAIIAPLMHRS